jgi:integrase
MLVIPWFGGVVLLDSVPLDLGGEWHGTTGVSAGVSPQGAGPGRGRQADRRIAQALGISDQSIYTWRRQSRIDQGVEPGLTSAEKTELAPLLDAVDLRGAHDFRHTFATWLEDAAIPARVIDELMGREATGGGAQQLGSAMGTHYRHTTPEMAAPEASLALPVMKPVSDGSMTIRPAA